MGLCDKRLFLLTLCSLQIITTAERQVFDFLGFMWMPILFNFFNIILVILGFFGAFQYRHRYVISYCVWNALWLTWNIFLACFYLDAAGLDKNSDLLNLGTGSFSWWHVNGPGCKPHFNTTIDQPDFGRPPRPDRVTGCVLAYEVIEVIHSSTQCVLAILAIITGILVCRAFLEEDDSFDFVGGGEFGMAGHTPLHPMYVSYSALPPAYAMHNKHQHQQQQQPEPGYYYPTNTATTTTGSSHRSSSTTLVSPPASDYPSYDRPSHNRGPPQRLDQLQRDSEQLYRQAAYGNPYPRHGEQESRPRQRAGRPCQPPPSLEFADYSSPIDQLPHLHHHHQQQQYQQGGGRLDYDTLETHTPNLGLNRHRPQPRQVPQPQQPPTYSPLASRSRHANRAASGTGGTASQHHNNRVSYRPRVYADLIREQQAPGGLRSFLSDPRLALPEQQQQQPQQNYGPARRDASGANRRSRASGDSGNGNGRPLSMFVTNYEQQQHYGGR